MYVKRFLRRIRYAFCFEQVKARRQQQSCERCGSFQWIDYSVNDDLWSKVATKNDCYCLNCFLEICTGNNIAVKKEDINDLFIIQCFSDDECSVSEI